jgi:hypothetical protein
VAKRYDLVFETDRFNLSQPKEHYINGCCYGDDVAAWLRGKLAELGIQATEPGQEDWGWYMDVYHQGIAYFVGVGGHAEDESSGNRGEWQFIIEKHRSLKEKLTGKNQMAEHEEILAILKGIIESEPDMTFLRIE